MSLSDIQAKVFAAFKKEYKNHLESIRSFLSENTTTAPPPAAKFDKIKISAHTLKGAARAASLPHVQVLALGLEMLFSRIRENTLTLEPGTRQTIQDVLDSVEEQVTAFSEGNTPEKPAQLFQRLNRILDINIEEPGTPKKEKPRAPKPVQPPPPGPTPRPRHSKLTLDREKIRQRVFAVFQQEYPSHLERIRRSLHALDESGASGPSPAPLEEAFREAHSLKGAARAADVPAVQAIAHRLESMFSRIKNKKLPYGPEVKRLINRLLDAVEDHITEPGETAASNLVLNDVDALLGDTSTPGGPDDLTANGDIPEDDSLIPEYETGLPHHQPGKIESIRIDAQNLERLQKTAGEILTENQRHHIISDDIADLQALLDDLTRQWDHVYKTSRQQLRSLEANREYARISDYIHFVNHHVQLLAKNSRALQKNQKAFSQTGRFLGAKLQQNIKYARMIAAESVFHHFRKMVRDLARDEGKDIEFQVTGLDIQADRLVFQSLKSPIMHLLRNAVSHGLETPQERKDAGKPETAHIRFHLEVRGNRLLATVTDDGKGLDYHRITQTALKKNLITPKKAEKISNRELAQLLFHPGFSTARMITDLSGRGVGLSVVKDTVTRLQGEYVIRPGRDGGTSITLSVPLTVTTSRLLLVESESHIFGIPASGIEGLKRIRVDDIEHLEGKPVIRLNGNPIPLYSLSFLLDTGDPTLFTTRDQVPLVILKSGEHHLAAAVNRFLDEQNVVVKELPGTLRRFPHFSGGFIRPDGSVALILNPNALVDSLKTLGQQAITVKTQETPKEVKKSRILIVDDSITTRTLEKTILDAHGYDVSMAVDGVEALNFLGINEVDLVITDIQMPRMDGFTLVGELKKDQRLKELPVIIVSSFDRKEDKERGMALGADAYILKQKFEQQNLLETIRQII